MEEGCSLDLGAAGKGIGCDLILKELETKKDVTAALMNLGLLIGPGKKVRLHICQHSCQLTVYIVTCGIECF